MKNINVQDGTRLAHRDQKQSAERAAGTEGGGGSELASAAQSTFLGQQPAAMAIQMPTHCETLRGDLGITYAHS
jgi:hypothetical protein